MVPKIRERRLTELLPYAWRHLNALSSHGRFHLRSGALEECGEFGILNPVRWLHLRDSYVERSVKLCKVSSKGGDGSRGRSVERRGEAQPSLDRMRPRPLRQDRAPRNVPTLSVDSEVGAIRSRLVIRRVAACLAIAAIGAACSSGPTAPAPASGHLYVANSGGNSVTVYSADTPGNTAPIATIAGSNTGLRNPWGIARDQAGRVYVANVGPSYGSPPTVTVYSRDSFGNVAPTATIAGSNTGLHSIGGGIAGGIAVDAAGRLYVANLGSCYNGSDSITVFAANATGNVAPTTTISGSNTGLKGASGIALAADGRLYVASTCNNSVAIFAPGASGNVAPLATIAGASTHLDQPSAIALDGAGQLYVENVTLTSNHAYDTITVYAAGATGNIAPVRMIGGSNTGLGGPIGMAVDAAGRLYVANGTINVYAPDAAGNVAPIATIAGSNTALSFPAGMTF